MARIDNSSLGNENTDLSSERSTPTIYNIVNEVVILSKDAQMKSTNKKLTYAIDRILPTIRSLIMRKYGIDKRFQIYINFNLFNFIKNKISNQENPYEIIKLKQIVKEEEYWLLIMLNLVDKIETDDPLGPSIIALFLEETPLPSKV